ncbi:MAG: hypothetical protein IKU64_07865 [Bacteroides sp.]|nr:hypothetical protein [Bacteroides sp.]
MRKYIFFFLILLVGLLSGCEGEADCSLSSVSLARFQFLDSKTHRSISFTQGAMVTGIALENGSETTDTVFNRAESYMSVPLSYTDQTTYVIHYTEIMRDTIVLKHKNIPFVGNVECPALMFYEVETMSYTTHALDSVKLINPKITNEETINFNIYYRTADTE